MMCGYNKSHFTDTNAAWWCPLLSMVIVMLCDKNSAIASESNAVLLCTLRAKVTVSHW